MDRNYCLIIYIDIAKWAFNDGLKLSEIHSAIKWILLYNFIKSLYAPIYDKINIGHWKRRADTIIIINKIY